VAALLGGNIDVMFVTPPSVIGLVKAGQLRALAFTGPKPFPELPDVALMKNSVPDYPPVEAWGIFFAPAKTPPEIVDKLNDAIRHALRVPAVSNVVERSGYIPDDRSPSQTAEFFRQQVEAAGKAVQAAGIEPN
jgi:tripartite-type tricarboxylate transporter receptor subunit TctC